jgi:GR25 family glycosyltransferase involved in LPS biosynthesis
LLPKKRSLAFGILNSQHHAKIEHIYVINLDRHPDRWAEIKSELRHALDWNGIELLNLAERVAAVDSTQFLQEPQKDSYLDPLYTLGDQLFVEPQPLTLPTRIDLSSKIRMSRPEIAIARSHIDVWRQMENGTYEYALILEDDIWFRAGFAQKLDQAWSEIMADKINKTNFDVFYLSFQEVKHGAPKTFISRNVFRPERGLWYLSGYVLSHKGAKKLLQLLPCRGPIDLWINHQFQYLDICAIKRPIIIQRRDLSSSN